MTSEMLVNHLKSSKEYLDRATRELTEEDSAFAPSSDSFTVAQQVDHIARTVDWFVEGAFGKGFDMDFEPQRAAMTRKASSLKDARDLCTQSYENAIKMIESKSPEQLSELIPDGPVMGKQPKFGMVAGITEHTAHHRGSLSVYTRLRGKVPPMPYMDMDAAPAS